MNEEIKTLKREQKKLKAKAIKISKMPEAKKTITAVRRSAEILCILIEIYKIQKRINIITNKELTV